MNQHKSTENSGKENNEPKLNEGQLKDLKGFFDKHKNDKPYDFYNAMLSEGVNILESAKTKLEVAKKMKESDLVGADKMIEDAQKEVDSLENFVDAFKKSKGEIVSRKHEVFGKLEEILIKNGLEDKNKLMVIKNKNNDLIVPNKQTAVGKANTTVEKKPIIEINVKPIPRKHEEEGEQALIEEGKKKNKEIEGKVKQEEIAQKIEKIKMSLNAAVVDVTELAEAQARDDANFRMTESQQERKKGMLKKWWHRMWKHNHAYDYYHRKYVNDSKSKIFSEKNIYANELGGFDKKNFEGAMDAVMERFTSEHKNEMLLEEEKKTVKPVASNPQINNLVKKFASGGIDETAFEIEKRKILLTIDKDYDNKDKLYTDNLLKFAQEVRDVCKHGKSINDLDINVELTLGRAKDRLQTAEQMRGFDKIWNKFKNTRVGRWIGNEAAVSLVGAAVYSTGKFFGLKALRSKLGQWFTFGGTAVAAGIVVGANEARRLEQERAQHSRESAKGMFFKEDDMKRRQEMDKYKLETVSSASIISALNQDKANLEKQNPDSTGISLALKNLIDIEARFKLNSLRKIDLVKYSAPGKVERERTDIDLLRAQIKVLLRKNNPNFDATFAREVENQQHHLLKNDKGGIEAIDRRFKHMKWRRAAFKGLTATVIGGVVGYVGHEAVGALSHWISGDHLSVPHGNGMDALIGGKNFNVPDGTVINANPDGTYSIVQGDKTIDGLHFDFDRDGNLTKESADLLMKNGVVVEPTLTGGHFTGSASEYIKNHSHGTTRMHRHEWMGQDTKESDYNELRVHWAGVNGTGVDENGDYVLDVSHMTSDGSWQNGDSVDAIQKMHSGELSMAFSLSRDTQHDVFRLPISSDGLIHVPKDSEVAKLMFEKGAKHPLFTGKFAEVVYSVGKSPKDGGDLVNVLATHVGHGKEMLDIDTTVRGYKLDLLNKPDTELPPYFYMGSRRPLEQGTFVKEEDKKPEDKKPNGDHGHDDHDHHDDHDNHDGGHGESHGDHHDGGSHDDKGHGPVKNVEKNGKQTTKEIKAAAEEVALLEAAEEVKKTQEEKEFPKDLKGAKRAVKNARKKLTQAKKKLENGEDGAEEMVKKAENILALAEANLVKVEAENKNPDTAKSNPDAKVSSGEVVDDSEFLNKLPKSKLRSAALEAKRNLEMAKSAVEDGEKDAEFALANAEVEYAEAMQKLKNIESAKETIKGNDKIVARDFSYLRKNDVVFIAGTRNAFVEVLEKPTNENVKFKNIYTGEVFQQKVPKDSKLVYMVGDINKFAKNKIPPLKSDLINPTVAAAAVATPAGARAPVSPVAGEPKKELTPDGAKNIVENTKNLLDRKFESIRTGDLVYIAGGKNIFATVKEGFLERRGNADKKVLFTNTSVNPPVDFEAEVLPNQVYLVRDLEKKAKKGSSFEPAAPLAASTAGPERQIKVTEIENLINEFPKAIQQKTKSEDFEDKGEVYLENDGVIFNYTKNPDGSIDFQNSLDSRVKYDNQFPPFTGVYLVSELKKLKEYKDKGETPPDLDSGTPGTPAVNPSAPINNAPTVNNLNTVRAPNDIEIGLKDIVSKNAEDGLTSLQDLEEGKNIFILGGGQDKIYTVKSVNKKTIILSDPNNVDEEITVTFNKGAYNIKKGKDTIANKVSLDFYSLDDSNNIEKKKIN
jgi:hypothetical protein